MSRPAWGLVATRTLMSLRSTSMQVVGSTAIAVVWWGICWSMEAKPKRSPWRGLGEDDLLPVLVDEGDGDFAVEHDVGGAVLVAGFVDTLLGGEGAELDLLGEDAEFVLVEKTEERDLAEFVWVAGHKADSRESRR